MIDMEATLTADAVEKDGEMVGVKFTMTGPLLAQECYVGDPQALAALIGGLVGMLHAWVNFPPADSPQEGPPAPPRDSPLGD